MDMFRGIDAGIFWLNNILLMTCALIPFPTSVLGDYPTTPVAVCFYGVCLALPALCFSLLRMYVLRHPDLLNNEVSIAVFRRGIWLSLIYGPSLYLFGAGLSWVSTNLAFAVYFFIPVYFIFPKAVKAN
ncbi:TMEM175 family protein [Spirosoma areae]